MNQNDFHPDWDTVKAFEDRYNDDTALLKQALDALEAMKAEFRALDLPYGSKAYALGNEATHALEERLK